MTLAMLAVGTLVLVPVAPASAAESRAIEAAAVDRLVESRLAASTIPGAALVLTEGDRVVHVRGFGHDSAGDPVTGATLFRIGSLSKSFTALAVMQLQDAGRLSLDDTVASHLPEFTTADPRGARITVRQILDHTSGLADRLVPDLNRVQPRTPAEATRALRSAHLVAAPGTEWNYSNPNYQVAARLIEVVSGEPYATYLERHVLEPSGMSTSSTTQMDDDAVPHLVDGHIEAYGAALRMPGPGDFMAGEGGVVSSAADLGRWLIVNANGGRAADGTRIVSAGGLRQLHAASAPNGYALGWATRGPRTAPTRIGHSGSVLTFSAEQAVLPERRIGVALLFNSSSAFLTEQRAIWDDVLRIVDGQAPRTPGMLPPPAIDGALALLTILVLGAGLLGGLHAQRWARRVGSRPAAASMGLLPSVSVLIAVACFPRIALWMMDGRDVTWRAAAYGWPALVVLVLAAALAALATLVCRVLSLLLLRAARDSDRSEEVLLAEELASRPAAPQTVMPEAAAPR